MDEEIMIRDADANLSVESLNPLKQPAKKHWRTTPGKQWENHRIKEAESL